MKSRYDPFESLIAGLIYFTFFMCIAKAFTMSVEGELPLLEDFLNSKMQTLFALDTVVEILAVFGVFHYRVVIAKILFNVFSLVYNLLIFIPLIFVKLVCYSIQSMMAVLLTIVVNSWGFDAEFSEFWPDWGGTKNRFLTLFKQFNGIHRTDGEIFRGRINEIISENTDYIQ